MSQEFKNLDFNPYIWRLMIQDLTWLGFSRDFLRILILVDKKLGQVQNGWTKLSKFKAKARQLSIFSHWAWTRTSEHRSPNFGPSSEMIVQAFCSEIVLLGPSVSPDYALSKTWSLNSHHTTQLYPYHTSWPKIAKDTEIMHINECNTKSSILGYFFIS